jgi:glycosyltransferase involved in cell wall biosynthesis
MFLDRKPTVAHLDSPAGGGHLRGGRRAGHDLVARAPSGKRITVVTVVFNAADVIEETMLSVIHQSNPGIEYIVVDGGSTDGTLQIIQKHEPQIDLWISEKDEGIYNAMNKGIALSSGDWIVFMNAGDRFHSDQTVDRVMNALDDRFAVVAGGVCYVYDAKHTRVKHMKLKFSGFYMSVPHHQASFINNRLMKRYRYDESYRIRGDLDFITRLHADGHDFQMIGEVICDVDTTGVSSGLSSVHIAEEIRAGRRIIPHYGLKCVAYHALYVAPRLLLRRLLPGRLESRIRSMVRN